LVIEGFGIICTACGVPPDLAGIPDHLFLLAYSQQSLAARPIYCTSFTGKPLHCICAGVSLPPLSGMGLLTSRQATWEIFVALHLKS
jgi:hypothetical protein